jgi:energy-converting hydrogenase Eha subunit A
MMVGPAVFMGKMTLLALYLRLFGHMQRIRWSIYAASFFALTLLVMTPLDAVKCGRIKGQEWGMMDPACEETYLYGVVQGTASLLIDLFILALPVPIIMRLNLSRRKRYGVLTIFLTGILAIVADIVVMKYRIDLYIARDPVWAGYLILLCRYVESVSFSCHVEYLVTETPQHHRDRHFSSVFIHAYTCKVQSTASPPVGILYLHPLLLQLARSKRTECSSYILPTIEGKEAV